MSIVIEPSRTFAETDRSPRAARPLQVAIVDEELPYPATSGKRIRTLNLLLRLAPRHRLTYLCHRNANPIEAAEAARFLQHHGIATVVVDRPVPGKSGPLFYARLAANLLSPLPYSVATQDSRQLRNALRRFAAANAVDLWHCEWTPYAQALQAVAGRRVVVAHNVESLIWQRYFETEANRLKRWYIGKQWRKFVRFERSALAAADRTIAVSDLDAERFRADFGVERVSVVENGVDTSEFRPTTEPRDRFQMLFLGSLDWRPNLDGVRHLLEQVLPAVQAAEPRATLSLVGRHPPEWLRREAAARPGVTLHADVPDVRPFLARCGQMVVPLRIGGGSRLKILEALAAGVPVVSTRIGAEGLHLDPERHLTIVPDCGALAPALVRNMRETERLAEQAAAGRRLVVDRYDWDALADQLEQAWMACVHTPGKVHA
jgi:glycosyltransferase involved in cell wall biosynthesis